jgi:hypothetical protein
MDVGNSAEKSDKHNAFVHNEAISRIEDVVVDEIATDKEVMLNLRFNISTY